LLPLVDQLRARQRKKETKAFVSVIPDRGAAIQLVGNTLQVTTQNSISLSLLM